MLIPFALLLRTKLKPVYKEVSRLTGTIEETCGLAETVSQKVRALDTIRERLKQTTKKVADIIDVKVCLFSAISQYGVSN